MKVFATSLQGVSIFEPDIFTDLRGFFSETFNKRRYFDAGLKLDFVQDNHSRSKRGVLRGLHCQRNQPQGKLVRVARGSIYDVVVDLRLGSPSFKKWFGIELSDENQKQVWIPAGFHHGFYTLTDFADVEYKCTDYYQPNDECSIRWNDPTLLINWPNEEPIMADKDRLAPLLSQVDDSYLPHYSS